MIVKNSALMIMVMMNFAGLSAMRCKQTQSKKSLLAQWTQARTNAQEAFALFLQTPEMQAYNAIKNKSTPAAYKNINAAYKQALTTTQYAEFKQARAKETQLRATLANAYNHRMEIDSSFE